MPVDTLVPLVIAVPLVLAGLLTAIRHHVPRIVIDATSVLAAGAVTGLGAVILSAVATGRDAFWSGGWQPRDGVTVGILLMADPISAGLVVLAGLLTVAAFVFSWRYFPDVEAYFHALMLVFLAGLCGFALSGDLFNMFVFFELLGAAAYALTGFRADQPHTVQGALTFGVVNSLGGYVTLLGIAVIYAETGELGLAQVGEQLRSHPEHAGVAVIASFVLICTGWLVKAGVAPFHFWSADAHAVAPTPVCALFSGIMSQLGIYAVARTYWTVYGGSLDPGAVSRALLILGALTAITGAVMSYTQGNLKRLLAFSTIAHIGLYLMAVGLLSREAFAGAGLLVLGDAGIKAALFFGTGVLLNRYETVEQRSLHGRGRDLPVTGAIFLLGGLVLAGLPPFATYAGKAIIEAAAVSAGSYWIVWCYVLVTAITAAAVLQAAVRIFLGWGSGKQAREDPGADAIRERSERAETERGRLYRLPWTMTLPGGILIVLTLVLGISTAIGVSFGHAAAIFMDTQGYIASALFGVDTHPAPAVAVHVWTTDGLANGLITTILAVVFGAAGVWHQRLPCVPEWARQPPLRALDALRGVHSGHLGDYVAWMLVGIAGFAALLILP